MRKLLFAIKDALIVLVGTFITALMLSFIDAELSNNVVYDTLGKLDVIHLFDDTTANGVITLGVILSLITFIYVLVIRRDDD
ncbi:hypothetical protein ACSBRB_06200 [Staphylococcus auricularis]|uniref:hypothetical protein n=1 Tax=Staphylococcus auricularis TaxID=29379 RepID=UPI003EB6D200